MDLYDIDFFSENGPPTCRLHHAKEKCYWNSRIEFKAKSSSGIPFTIDVYLRSVYELIAFKNSVLQAYEELLRREASNADL